MAHCFRHTLILIALVALTAGTALADNQFIRTRLSVVAQSTDDNTVNWVNTVVQPHANCNYALYMPFTDKEMFAAALTSQAQKIEAEIYYNSQATSKSMPGYAQTSSCKITSINMKYVP